MLGEHISAHSLSNSTTCSTTSRVLWTNVTSEFDLVGLVCVDSDPVGLWTAFFVVDEMCGPGQHVRPISSPGPSTLSYALSRIVGKWGFWAHPAGASTPLDEGRLTDTSRYREELRNLDGNSFLLRLIRHVCSPCLSDSDSLHVILWVRLVGIRFLEEQFSFCYKLHENVSLVGFSFLGKSSD